MKYWADTSRNVLKRFLKKACKPAAALETPLRVAHGNTARFLRLNKLLRTVEHEIECNLYLNCHYQYVCIVMTEIF